MTIKHCRVCTKEFVARNSQKSCSWTCMKLHHRRWRRRYQRKWYQRHKESEKARVRAYYARKKEESHVST